MSLRFIIGGSGAGKTTELYRDLIRESMEHPERRYFAIVPEQFTMQTQKEIVDLHPRHAVMNIDIVSFDRLAHRVFEELAVKQLAVLDDMGKAMVIRKTAAKVKDELSVFGRHLDKPGFIDEIKSQLSEFFQYGIGEEKLEAMIPEVGSALLRAKLSDMLTVTRAYHAFTEGTMASREEIPEIFCSVLPQSELLKNAVVTLDGFTGFTPVQYHILEILLSMCAKVTVTVTMDPNDRPYQEGSPEDLFYLSRHTVCRLIDLASQTGAGREEDLLLGLDGAPRFLHSPELQAIERHIFRRCRAEEIRRECDAAKDAGKDNGLFLLRAQSAVEEAGLIVAEISRLVKTKGYRYRDIAVITGDPDSYRGKFEHAFAEAKIPCFIDSKKSIMENPATELVRAALEVLRSDFSYESVFRYLKTGLVLVTDCSEIADAEEGSGCSTDDYSGEEWIRFLENYVAALGIRGYKRWSETWERTYTGAALMNLDCLNHVRAQVLAPFAKLKEVWGKRGVTVKERTEALTGFLGELHIEEKLEKRADEFCEEGRVDFEREYRQVYGLIVDLFERITALLGDETVSRAEYSDILDAGFAEIKVGLIPAVIDRVVVGDITRTRLAHVKVLFFAGVNDGIVPASGSGTGILSESERRMLRKQQIEIAPTAREDGFLQRFYLYLALTKASEKLYVSYSMMSASGGEMRPSSLIASLRKLFPEKKAMSTNPKNMAVWSEAEGLRRLAKGLRDGRDASGDILELYRKYTLTKPEKEDGSEVNPAKRLVPAAFWSYTEEGIGKEAARLLYSPILSGSVSRLEKYANCAYAHFLNYGLGLQPRIEFELQASDIGTLYHSAIEGYFRQLMDEKRLVTEVPDGERLRRVQEAVSAAAGDYGNRIMDASARNRYLVNRMIRTADRTAWALTEQLRKGDFVPHALEMDFSAREGLRAMHIPLGEDQFIDLRGRIDRVDLCEDGDDLYVKIIDYKTGGNKFDLKQIYYGLQLQLVVYMQAAMEKLAKRYPERRVHPAGLFYYRIRDPFVKRENAVTEESRISAILQELRPNGAVNEDIAVLSHFDHDLRDGGDPKLKVYSIPVSVGKGGIKQADNVMDEAHLDALGRYADCIMIDAGRQILGGTAAVNPVKDGSTTSCDWCPYHAICGFDAQTAGFAYRKLSGRKAKDIWPEIEKRTGIATAEDEEDGSEPENGSPEKNGKTKPMNGNGGEE